MYIRIVVIRYLRVTIYLGGRLAMKNGRRSVRAVYLAVDSGMNPLLQEKLICCLGSFRDEPNGYLLFRFFVCKG